MPSWRSESILARVLLLSAGAAAMAWAVATFPVFQSENSISNVARGVKAGEVFKVQVLNSAEAKIRSDESITRRSSALQKVALIRLRRAEDAINTGDVDAIDRDLESLSRAIDNLLASAPSDSFFWFVRFWLADTRFGLHSENLAQLRMSYEQGPYEGWISVKRNRTALAILSILPRDLADRAIAEFVALVRWGFSIDAAEIAARLDRPRRELLFARLKDVKIEQRRQLADALYKREVDDVLVPGIEPPSQPSQMPILPPGY